MAKEKTVLIDLIDTKVLVNAKPGSILKYDLTRYCRGRVTDATLEVIEDKGQLKAIFKRLRLVQSYVKRLVRKGTSWVEDSFQVKAKDKLMRIKPLLVTRKKVSRSIKKHLREKCRELIEKFVTKSTARDVFNAIITGVLQKSMSKELKRIYPLAVCEIRWVETKEK